MDETIKKCRWCSQLYLDKGQPYCMNCLELLDENFKIIREYLYEYPNAHTAEVIEATGVEQRVITYLLKEKRLQLVDSISYIKCTKCGKPISTGEYCTKCAEGLIRTLDKYVKKVNEDGTLKMHTFKNRGLDVLLHK